MLFFLTCHLVCPVAKNWKQPELWTEAIFEKMYRLMKPGGSLVTYCAKGAVRRAMIAAGFEVEKLPGPPGKREMLRANRRLDK